MPASPCLPWRHVAGKEIALRAAMEDSLCRNAEEIEGRIVSTVMVLLVVAGGVGTLTTVLTVLEKKRPVVVLSDSGGVAKDIFDYVANGIMPINQFEVDDQIPGPHIKHWLFGLRVVDMHPPVVQ